MAIVTCDGCSSDSSDGFATVLDSGNSTVSSDGRSELSGIGGAEVSGVSLAAISCDGKPTFPDNGLSVVAGNCGAVIPALDALLVTDLVIGTDESCIPVRIYLFDLVLNISGFFQASRSR
ncbi:hypothetical protein C4K13_1639 [Pseudomonas chlororaphis subsp. aureofaciens]|nr:hypothetical protein C4K13_1639 [Pseudomonas chlororaphis subsp. aureofaciens]SDT38390.1 hypothetical protein SAMN04489803_4055 [Pseudomonas chlororaphis]SUD23600.1 Uncharacterised protein [Pseudomonas chlororaphis]